MQFAESTPRRGRQQMPVRDEEVLQEVVRHLEGLERLQQMQWRLLKQVIREVEQLKLS